MICPALAARRLLLACLLGAVLGLVYGFLRPLRPRRTALSDLLFLPAALWVWVYFSFGLCEGDLRVGYIVGMGLSAAVWEATAGRWLRPLFYGFWRAIGKIWNTLLSPVKKIFKKAGFFVKNLFAMGKKSGILKWNKLRPKGRRPGGVTHGKEDRLFQPVSAGVPAQLTPAEVRRAGYHRIVYGGADRPAGGDHAV